MVDAPASGDGSSSELAATLDAPWLSAAVQQLQRMRAAGRFPTALLIHDQHGAGGRALAHYAAQLLLCQRASPPCGVCRDCRQFMVQQHPDFIRIEPTEDSKLIRVEQIRELCEQLALTAHGGAASVTVIAPADSMNAAAANALLKTLEEPRPGVTLILVSAVPSRLPATIRSRCQRLRVSAPNRAASLAWLERRRGEGPWQAVLEVLGEAPFEALMREPTEIARLKSETERALEELVAGRLEVSSVAERWGRAEHFELRLACLENWLTARIDQAAGRGAQSREMGSGAYLPEREFDMNMAGLMRVLDSVYDLRRLRLSSINRPLALEQLLWELARRH